MMRSGDIAIVGASESTEIGTVPNVSSTGLALDGAANALADAGLTAKDIDGLTTGYFPLADISRQLGIFPRWGDNTIVGGCSWMFQLRSAAAAINAGYCDDRPRRVRRVGPQHPSPDEQQRLRRPRRHGSAVRRALRRGHARRHVLACRSSVTCANTA